MAEKQFLQLTKIVRVRVAQAIVRLGDDPGLGKQLKGELRDYRSLRVGDYRVIYYVRHNKIQIEVIRISHRRDVYRG